MIPVRQTSVEPEAANCFAACIASILEVPLEEVPDITALRRRNAAGEWEHDDDEVVVELINGYLVRHALVLRHLATADLPTPDWRPEGSWIAGTQSTRYPFAWHATVWKDNELVWDPDPGNPNADPRKLRELELVIWLAAPACDGVAAKPQGAE